MSLKIDFEKVKRDLSKLIDDKRKEIAANKKELRRIEGELVSLITIYDEVTAKDKKVTKILRRAKSSEKELTEALIESLTPPQKGY